MKIDTRTPPAPCRTLPPSRYESNTAPPFVILGSVEGLAEKFTRPSGPAWPLRKVDLLYNPLGCKPIPPPG
ncbi:hypothetical protein AGR7C_Lc100091 [Agrobacterium deltaense Zutra 3/1]|uniref:Uncharacterized protein n=1 Tax=Agrobacterium deltaense Zutra 3/1 TaxID=1183427 RepID=A0A1S7QSR8_9HYPH|nr:hypothetical protein AGR7C_Lc100091 [Agrobacterium deltaense Zutra 3/1]